MNIIKYFINNFKNIFTLYNNFILNNKRYFSK